MPLQIGGIQIGFDIITDRLLNAPPPIASGTAMMSFSVVITLFTGGEIALARDNRRGTLYWLTP